jgi:hypothetical protein
MNILKKLNFFKWSWKKSKNSTEQNNMDDNTDFYLKQPSDYPQQGQFTNADAQAVEIARQMDLEEKQKTQQNNATLQGIEDRIAASQLSWLTTSQTLQSAVARYTEQKKEFGHDDALSRDQIKNLQLSIEKLKMERQQLELEKKTFLMSNPQPTTIMNPPPNYPYQQQSPFPPTQPQYTPQPPVMPQPYQVPQPQYQAPQMQQTQSDFLLQLLYQEIISMKAVLVDIQRNTAPVKQPKLRKSVERTTTE